jgi:hypothetical protein
VLRMSAFVLAMGLATSSVSAMPLMAPAGAIQSDNVLNVKIICQENGYCYQRGRRPSARWVYGEGNFSGPYTGPAYYSWPGNRWRWWPF